MKLSQFKTLIREEVRKVLKEYSIDKNATGKDILTNPHLFLSMVSGPYKLSKSAADDGYDDPNWIKFEKAWLVKAMPILTKLKANANTEIPKEFISKLEKVASDDDSLYGMPDDEIDTYPEIWGKQLKVLTALAAAL